MNPVLPPHEDDPRWLERLRASAPAPSRTPDLWPGIRARLETALPSTGGVPAAALSVRRAHRRSARRHRLSALLACSGLLLVVALALPLGELGPAPSPHRSPGSALDTLVVREADALQREYAAAFAQFERAPLLPALRPGLEALSAEGDRIFSTLRNHPQQTRLLEKLRRVHERRLDLLRHGATSNV